MNSKKKILIITPIFPYPIRGAYEADRAEGFKQFIRLGYEIKIITKVTPAKLEYIKPVSEQLGVEIIPVAYKFSDNSKLLALKKYFKILLTKPSLLDGAAYEYSDSYLITLVKEIVGQWQPHYLWLDSSYMWPLINGFDRKSLKVITRSVNFESSHFLQEEGLNPKNIIWFLAKVFSEIKTAKLSDLLLVVTPADQKSYQKVGAKKVAVLPLRGLPACLQEKKEIRPDFPLNVFFAGATYNVKHNKKALEFILREVGPQINKALPDKFIFNIFGGKFPDEFKKYLNQQVLYHGFVDDYQAMMEKMDIALIPSLSGGGMQQKIFEPLVRGIPTITSPRGLAGYSFEDRVHLLLAKNAPEFVRALKKIQDLSLRKNLSQQAIELSQKLFNQKRLDEIVVNQLNAL